MNNNPTTADGEVLSPAGAACDGFECSLSLGAFSAAMCKVQVSLTNVTKDKTAKIASQKGNYSYAYAGLPEVVDMVRPLLGANGISMYQTHASQSERGLEILTTLVHTSGEWIRSRLYLPVAVPDVRGIGSATTYGRRYALMSLLGIAAEDDDGEAAVQGHAAAPPAQPAQNGRQAPVRPAAQPASTPSRQTTRALGDFMADFTKLGASGTLADLQLLGKRIATELVAEDRAKLQAPYLAAKKAIMARATAPLAEALREPGDDTEEDPDPTGRMDGST